MTEKQFAEALYDSQLFGGVTLEDFKAAKKMEEILDSVLSEKEASVVLTVTFSGLDEDVLKWDENMSIEEAKEIYDVALKKLKAAAGVES